MKKIKKLKKTKIDPGDKNLIAFCGLYCGGCRQYLAKKCLGCKKNVKATWCTVRTCCMQNKYKSCADCKEFKITSDCKKFNNFFSKFFALVFRSDRQACVDKIKSIGYHKYASEMAKNKVHTIKKK